MLTVHYTLQERPDEERRRVADSRHPGRRRRRKAFAEVVVEREGERITTIMRVDV